MKSKKKKDTTLIHSMYEFLQTYFPKKLEKRQKEDRCIYCGAHKGHQRGD